MIPTAQMSKVETALTGSKGSFSSGAKPPQFLTAQEPAGPKPSGAPSGTLPHPARRER